MVYRMTNLVIACWALQVSPALCLAGVLSHACDPQVEGAGVAHCIDEGNHEQPEPGSCSHEDNCNTDPCQDGRVIKDGGTPFSWDGMVLSALPGFLTCVVAQGTHVARVCSEVPAHRPRLPLNPSDLPLLL